MTTKNTFLILVLILIAGSIFYLESQKVSPETSTTEDADITVEPQKTPSRTQTIEEKVRRFERAKEITSPDGFINTDGISISEHIGKNIVLVDFWTYSCINCQRTLPYLNQWHEKYKDKGLVIIGLHTPEFKFEEEYANVKKAVENFNVRYPVVLDNDYSTWRSYQNRYWPRKYLIDIDGFIVYDHIGEGAYAETEKKIQELLEERMRVLAIDEELDKKIVTPEGAETVDHTGVGSPEIYFGAGRNNHLGNGILSIAGEQTFTEPSEIKPNILYLVGDWDITREYAENKSIDAKITFRYQAQKVFFVASSEKGATIQILRDGQPVSDAAGRDVGEGATIRIEESQLYRLIEDDTSGVHTLEIIITEPGLRAFTFTFG